MIPSFSPPPLTLLSSACIIRASQFLPFEGLTMLKRAEYLFAKFATAIAIAMLLVALPGEAQQTPINPDAYAQLKYR